MNRKSLVLYVGLVSVATWLGYSLAMRNNSPADFPGGDKLSKTSSVVSGSVPAPGAKLPTGIADADSPPSHTVPPPAPSGPLPGPPPPPPPPKGEEFLKGLNSDVRQKITSNFSKAPFFQALAPADQERFLGIVMESERKKMELFNPANGQRPSEESFAAIRRSMDQSVRELVGESTFGEYTEHQKNAPHRTVVDLLNRNSSEPLSEETSETLVSILRKEAEALRAPSGSPQGRQSGQQELANMAQRVEQQASTLLTPDQTEALKQTLSRVLRIKEPKK